MKMKQRRWTVFSLIISITAGVVSCNVSAESTSSSTTVDWEDNFTMPEQDEDGWSVLTPSEDSRLIYVSSTDGNDSTAEVYSLSDSVIGDDPYLPVGTIQPYATLDAATNQMRNDYPDYVFLKKGDTWSGTTLTINTHGRSAKERAVVTSYGDSDERPFIKNAGSFLMKSGYIALVGIHFEDAERNPNSDEFVGFDEVGKTKGISATLSYSYGGFLIEDCWFNWFAGNVIQSYSFDGDSNLIPVEDIIIRRNLFTNNYSVAAHSQGLYSATTSVLLEENIFDHNGWYQQGDASTKSEGKATKFNHNTYFGSPRNTIFRRNLFLRSSSIGSKFTSNTSADEGVSNQIRAWNIQLDDNLYVEGEVGISLGGNNDQDDGPRWQNIYVTNNVLMHIGRTQPTNRDLGWGLDVDDWDSGEVSGNIFTQWGDSTHTNNWAIISQGDTNDVLFHDNIVYGLYGSQPLVQFLDDDLQTGINFYENEVQATEDDDISSSGRLLTYSLTETGGFYDNYYYSTADEDSWFSGQGEKFLSLSEYRNYSGDMSSVAEARDYTDPERTLETYLASLGYDTDMDSFVALLTQQSKSNWRTELTADVINDYIRNGFCISGEATCR
jgi:hypothetical protein